MKEDDFRKRMVLNIALGVLGLLSLGMTLTFLWGSPGLFNDSVNNDSAGVGTGFLCILNMIYLVIITSIIWDKPNV